MKTANEYASSTERKESKQTDKKINEPVLTSEKVLTQSRAMTLTTAMPCLFNPFTSHSTLTHGSSEEQF